MKKRIWKSVGILTLCAGVLAGAAAAPRLTYASQNVEAADHMNTDLGLMLDVAHTAAYMNWDGRGELSAQNKDSLWNTLRLYAIFQAQTSGEEHANYYAASELCDIAYAFFDDFDGNLGTPTGPVKDEGSGYYSFYYATPQEQRFRQYGESVQEGENLVATYSLEFFDLGLGTPATETLFYEVTYQQNPHRNTMSYYDMPYTITRIEQTESLDGEALTGVGGIVDQMKEAAASNGVSYSTYHNDRFGYEMKYPSYFTQEGDLPQNGDGIRMAGNGAALIMNGGYNVLFYTPQQYYENYCATSHAVTDFGIGEDYLWYYEMTDGMEGFQYVKFHNMNEASFTLRYPESEKASYKSVIDTMIESMIVP